MFTPTVIELRSALDVVSRDPFLEDRDEATQPAVRPHTAPVWRSQRALVEAALLRVPVRTKT